MTSSAHPTSADSADARVDARAENGGARVDARAEKNVENGGENGGAPEGIEARTQTITLEIGYPAIYNIVLAVIGVVALGIAVYSVLHHGLGTLSRPRPGMWPFIASVLILLCIPATYRRKEAFEVFNGPRVLHVMWMVVGLLAFCLLYPLVGFILAGIVALIIIARLSAEESWRNTLLIAVITSVVCWLIFGYLFQVPLSPVPAWLAGS